MRQVLTRASRQLFRRPPDEGFETLPELHRYCQGLRDNGRALLEHSTALHVRPHDGDLQLAINEHAAFRMND